MEVTLNIPSFFPRFASFNAEEVDAWQLDALQLLLSRAKVREDDAVGYFESMYQLFTGNNRPSRDIPYASMTALLDGLDSRSGWWMRADPVYLQPDTHSLIMQDPAIVRLAMDEREELVEAIKDLFSDVGATLHAPGLSRWYLHFPENAPDIECVPVHEATMQPVNNLLPTGPDSKQWHRMFNEIQMVLNQSLVNESRQYHGKVPVNSLWFWGLGQLPASDGSVYGCCIGGGDFVRALCKHTGNRHRELGDGLTVSRYQDNALIVDERLYQAEKLNDPSQWLQGLQQIHHDIVQPLVKGLRQGDIRQLTLITNDNLRYCITPRLMKSFWRRSKPLSHYLLTE